MMGKDLASLQALIDQLEELVTEQKEQEAEDEKLNIQDENLISDNTITNTVSEVE